MDDSVFLTEPNTLYESPLSKSKKKTFLTYVGKFFMFLIYISIPIIITIVLMNSHSFLSSYYATIPDILTDLNTSDNKINEQIKTLGTSISNNNTDDINKQLNQIKTSVGDLAANRMNDMTTLNNKLGVQPLFDGNNIPLNSGWAGPFYLNFPKHKIPEVDGKYLAKNQSLDLTFNGSCFDVSQNKTTNESNPTANTVGGLYGCDEKNESQMYYFNNITGQLYNMQNKQCLTIGNDPTKPQAEWVKCNTKDNTQSFNLSNNRLQYIDSSALDVSIPQGFNTSLKSSNDEIQFKNQYVNFLYSN